MKLLEKLKQKPSRPLGELLVDSILQQRKTVNPALWERFGLNDAKLLQDTPFGKLREEEKTAVRAYAGGLATHGNVAAAAINEQLRRGDDFHPNVKLIDKAIRRSRLEKDQSFYRGLDYYYGSLGKRPSFSMGQVVTDEAFLSTSSSKKVAQDFAKSSPNRLKGGLVLQIDLPSGSRALPLPNFHGDPKVGMHHNEREVLLPRNLKLKIVAVGRPTKDNVVTIRAVAV